MRRMILLFVLLALIASLTIIVIAQNDDPNFCLNGIWQCADPDNPAREEWNYTCGWYLGMYNAGRIDGIPSWCGTPYYVEPTGTLEDGTDHNLCLDGTWQCADPENPAREEWNYTCGWYLGTFYAGELNNVPSWCGYPLSPATGCYDGPTGLLDFYYNDIPDTVGNVTVYSSEDGMCVADTMQTTLGVVINTTSAADAVAYCQTIDSRFNWAEYPYGLGYPIGASFWICFTLTP